MVERGTLSATKHLGTPFPHGQTSLEASHELTQKYH